MINRIIHLIALGWRSAFEIVLLTVVIPAVRGLLETSQLAQADNTLRAVLISARSYALRNGLVAGVRFQDDGHAVQVYARNTWEVYNLDNFTQPPVYDLVAVAGLQPERLPDPWRVSARDVGKFSYYFTWPATWRSNANWLNIKGGCDGWFVFPTVLFSPRGRVILGRCIYRGARSQWTPWYPTLEGSFGKVTDIEYSYQGANQADTFTITGPTTTSQPMLFNYLEFKGHSKADLDAALMGLDAGSTDCLLDVNTGMIVRTRDYMGSSKN